jgi:hypothetical protein
MSEKRPPKLAGNEVNAYCPVCDARSNFVREAGGYSPPPSRELHEYYRRLGTGRMTFLLLRCVTCSLGAFAALYEPDSIRGYSMPELACFHPYAFERLRLPEDTPDDIVSEFRSAENCAGIGEYRPAAAMLRSAIEKVLKKHGYDQWNLQGKLNQLKEDRIITGTLAKQNREIVKILADDVLHGEWRDISSDEYEKAYKYAHKLIDGFYDDHKNVLEELAELERIVPDTKSAGTEEQGTEAEKQTVSD